MEHAKKDCFEKLCDRKTCMNRHRKHCKFNKQCKYQRKGTCQFLHIAQTNPNKDKLTEYKCQIDSLKKEIKTLQTNVSEKVEQLNILIKSESNLSQKVEELEQKLSTVKRNYATLEKNSIENVNKLNDKLKQMEIVNKNLKKQLDEKETTIKSLSAKPVATKNSQIETSNPAPKYPKCQSCVITFLTNESLEIHIKEKHTVKVKDTTVMKPANIAKPEQTVSKPTRFECTFCDGEFLTKEELITHVQKIHPCKICCKIFSEKKHLLHHVENEHNESWLKYKWR